MIGVSAVIALWLAVGSVGKLRKAGKGNTEEELGVGIRVEKRRTIMCDVKW